MEVPQEQIDNMYQNTVMSVRAMAEAALAADDERMLAMLAAAGGVAMNFVKFQELAARPAETPPVVALVPETPETPEVLEVPEHPEAIEPDAKPEVDVIEAAPPVVASNTTPRESEPITFTDEETILLNTFRANPRKPLKSAELNQAIGASTATGRAVLKRLIAKLEHSPDAGMVRTDGATRSRCYTWLGDSLEVTESAPVTPAVEPMVAKTPSPLGMPKRQPEHPAVKLRHSDEETAPVPVVTKEPNPYGLEFTKNGVPHCSVKGVPLVLTPIAAEVLSVVMDQEHPLLFKDLVAKTDSGEPAKMRELVKAVEMLGPALAEHGIPWNDTSTFNTQLRKKQRMVYIGESIEDADPTSFLVRRRLS